MWSWWLCPEVCTAGLQQPKRQWCESLSEFKLKEQQIKSVPSNVYLGLSAPLLLGIMLCMEEIKRSAARHFSTSVKGAKFAKSALPRPASGIEYPIANSCGRLRWPPRSFQWNRRTHRADSPATGQTPRKRLKWTSCDSHRFPLTSLILNV